MSDLGARADDYERRLAASGNTEEIISELIKTTARGRKFLRYLMISLIIDITLSLAMAGLAWVAFVQANDVEKNTTSIAQLSHKTCDQSNRNSSAINDFLGLIITSYKDGSQKVTKEEAKRQIERYEKMRVEIFKC